MSKDIINILYNPGSISTAGTGKSSQEQDDAVLFDNNTSTYSQLNDLDLQMLDCLETLVQATNEKEICFALMGLKESIAYGTSRQVRPHMLQEYNNYLSRVSQKHPESSSLFQQSLEVILEFKKQIDKNAQTQGFLSQTEWVELERSLYCLSVWEEKLADNPEMSLFSP